MIPGLEIGNRDRLVRYERDVELVLENGSHRRGVLLPASDHVEGVIVDPDRDLPVSANDLQPPEELVGCAPADRHRQAFTDGG